MTNKDSGYDDILKYTGIFGGVQGVVNLITLLKVVLVSKLLGPIGVGIVDVYNRSVELVKKATDLGISYSAVQSISEQRGSDGATKQSMAYAVRVVRSWALWMALAGTLLFFLLAPLLCRWSFDGDTTHTLMVRLLSLSVGCSLLMGGELAVLKGARMLGRVAWYQVLSAVVMLAIVIPCYYFGRLDGIVPSLLLSAIGLLLTACYHSFKVYPYRVSLFSRRVLTDGLYIIRQGINYTLAGLFNSSAYYFVSVYIFNSGSAADVGCYSYGTLLISYLSMLVFSALDSDFFPRLSAVNKNSERSNALVNSYVEVLLVLIAPMAICFALCVPLLTFLIFDEEFMPLVGMAQWAVVGLVFKALLLPPANLSLSKGDSRIFLLQEVVSYAFMVAVMALGFRHFGLIGLGVGILLSNMFDWLSVWAITAGFYRFRYSRRVWRLFALQFPLLVLMLVVVNLCQGWTYILFGTLCLLLSGIFSLRFLQRHTDFIRRLIARFGKER